MDVPFVGVLGALGAERRCATALYIHETRGLSAATSTASRRCGLMKTPSPRPRHVQVHFLLEPRTARAGWSHRSMQSQRPTDRPCSEATMGTRAGAARRPWRAALSAPRRQWRRAGGPTRRARTASIPRLGRHDVRRLLAARVAYQTSRPPLPVYDRWPPDNRFHRL